MLKAEDGTLTESLRKELGVDSSFPIFVPCLYQSVKGKPVVISVIEGYAFVSSGLPEVQYLRLQDKTLVKKVLTVRGPGGLKVLATIPDIEIQKMVEKFREMVHMNVSEGDLVRISSGLYATMEGVVVDLIDKDHVLVRIKLRSKDILTKVTKSMLRAPGEPPEDTREEDIL